MNRELVRRLHPADHVICTWLVQDILELKDQFMYCARKIQIRGMVCEYLHLWYCVMDEIVLDLGKCYGELFLILEEVNLLEFWPRIGIW